MTKSLTIALPTGAFLPSIGGVEVGLHNIAIRLKKLGHKPVVIASFKKFLSLKRKKIVLPYDVIPLPPKIAQILRSHPNLAFFFTDWYLQKIQNHFKIDCWHCTTVFPIGILFGHFAVAKKNPYLVRAVGADIQKLDSVRYGFRLDTRVDYLVKKWLPTANYVVATTQSIVEEYNTLGVQENRILRIPNGVDTKRFRMSVDREKVRKANNIPTSRFMFLCVGRNHPKKGFIHLIEAVEKLSLKARRDFIVVFVGEGLENLESLARSKGISNYFCFKHKIDGFDKTKDSYEFPSTELIELYKAADSFVFPSLIESFGIVLVEAMAAGLPIITTNVAGCKDIVEHGANGVLVSPANAVELSESMHDFLENDSKLKQYSDENLRTACKFDWDSVVEKYIDCYRKMLAD